MKKNTSGSILVTAVVIIMIIMVILGASLSIASSYYTSSINENTKKQVYLSAKSGADLLVNYVQSGNNKIIPNVKETIAFDTMEVEEDPVDKEGSIQRIDESTIKIVVDAKFDEFTYSIQVILENSGTAWEIKSYCEAKEGEALC